MTFEGSKEENAGMKGKKENEELGERAEMVQYYHYWENCMLNALSKCILKALITLNGLFTIDSSSTSLTLNQKKQNGLKFFVLVMMGIWPKLFIKNVII